MGLYALMQGRDCFGNDSFPPRVACQHLRSALIRTKWEHSRPSGCVIDLRRRTYKGRRGLVFWTQRLRGPLEDFDSIRGWLRCLRIIVRGRRGWALEFVWRHERHRAFRVTHWRTAPIIRVWRIAGAIWTRGRSCVA